MQLHDRTVYLLLDLAQDSDDRLRFRTCIFLDEYLPIFYVDVSDETDKIELLRFTPSKNSSTKLRKAIISNCNRELLNRIIECVLNLLNGNLKVSNCARRMLQNIKEYFARSLISACLILPRIDL